MNDTHQLPDVPPQPYRPWWPAVTLGALAAAVLAIAVTVLAVAMVADREDRIDRSDVTDCRAVYSARITEASNASRSALNEVVIALADAIVADIDIEAAVSPVVDDLERSDDVNRDVANARDTYLAAGSPLPCPIDALTPLTDIPRLTEEALR